LKKEQCTFTSIEQHIKCTGQQFKEKINYNEHSAAYNVYAEKPCKEQRCARIRLLLAKKLKYRFKISLEYTNMGFNCQGWN